MTAMRIFMLVLAGVGGIVTPARSQSDTLRLYSSHDSVPLDPNGFLFNPRWLNNPLRPPNIERLCRFRVLSGHLDERRLVTTGAHPCLSQDERRVVTVNETPATMGLGFICASNSQTGEVRGHVNWFPVTVTGQLRWNNFAGGAGEDYDLAFDLSPTDSNATTSGNRAEAELGGQRSYELEFYARETLDSLPSVPGSVPAADLGWWYLLKRSLRRKDEMKQLVDGRFAIVTGLFGLDGVHDFQAELHPVLAMSVLLSVGRSGGRTREEWAVMLRNRGNGGECSVGRMALSDGRDSLQTFIVDLGAWDGAGAPAVSLGPSWSWGVGAPRVKATDRHLYVAFTQPRPAPASAPSLFLGTLIVEWSSDGSGAPFARLKPWLSSHAQPLKVDGVKPDSVVVNVAQTAMKLAPGLSGSRVLGDTSIRDSIPAGASRLAPRPLGTLDSVWEVRRRAEPTLAYFVARPVSGFCAANDVDNPVCTRSVRFIFGATDNVPSWAPFGSIYWLPRGVKFVKHLPLGEFWNGLGWRVDVRPDRFERRCENICTAGAVRGVSARLSGQFVPNHFVVAGVATVSPYFNMGVGAFWPKRHPVNGAWNVGLGAQFETNVPLFSTFMAEFQNYLSGGGLLTHWTFNVGTVWSARRFWPRRRAHTSNH